MGNLPSGSRARAARVWAGLLLACALLCAQVVEAGGLQHHHKLTAVEQGMHRVVEVLFGCVVGIAVSWILSKVWPLPEARAPKPPGRSQAG